MKGPEDSPNCGSIWLTGGRRMSASPGWELVRASKVIHKIWRSKWTGNIQLAPG
jgi:hypothetical protein